MERTTKTETEQRGKKRPHSLILLNESDKEAEPLSDSSSSSSFLDLSLSIDADDINDARGRSPPPKKRRLRRKGDKTLAKLPSSSSSSSASSSDHSGDDDDDDDDLSEDPYGSHDDEAEMDSFIVSDDESSASNERSDEDEDDEDDDEESNDASSEDLMDIELDDDVDLEKPKKKKKKKEKKNKDAKKKTARAELGATNLDALALQLADILPWDANGNAPDEMAKKLVAGETAGERLKARQEKLEKSTRHNLQLPTTSSSSSSSSKNINNDTKRRGGDKDSEIRSEWREFVAERDEARDSETEKAAASDKHLRKHLSHLKHGRHNVIGLIDRPDNRPYFHQLSGVAWAMFREILPYKRVRGGALCDDMGVGKTSEMLMLIAMDRINGYYTVPGSAPGVGGDIQYRAPNLVCCPNTLLSTWADEVSLRFDQRRLNMIVLHDSHTPNWRNTLSVETMAETDILVINYEGLGNIYKELRDELLMDIRTHPQRYNNWLNETDDSNPNDEADEAPDGASIAPDINSNSNLSVVTQAKRAEFDRKVKRLVANNLQIGFRTIWKDTKKWKPKHFIYGWGFLRLLLDECTQVKNDETLRFTSVHAINAQRRWCISGTPLENHIDELYSQLVILGINREAHSIRDKLHWHRLVASSNSNSSDRSPDEPASSSLTPDADVVRKLKRRFLNVHTLRREIQNINAVNPLGAYVKRAFCTPAESALWDLFVSTRTTAKRERAIRRHEHQRSRRSMAARFDNASDSWWSSSLTEITLHQLTHSESGKSVDIAALTKLVQSVPEGFYWYTSQRQFLSAYHRVDAWMQEAFGISLLAISEAGEAARTYMRDAGIRVPTTIEHSDAIRNAILEGIRRHAVDPEHLTQVTILGNFPIPKPLLFVAEAHELEKAVYDDARSIARQLTQDSTLNINNDTVNNAFEPSPYVGRDSQNNQNVAFRCITRCRTACLDYRSARNAATFLTQQRGTLWDVDGSEPFDLIDVPTVPEETAAGSIGALIGGAGGGGGGGGATIDEYDVSPDDKKELELFKAAELKEQRHDKAMAEARKDKLQSVPMPRRVPTKYLMYLRYIKATPATDKLIFFSDLVSYLPRLKRFFEENGVRTVTLVGGMHGATRDEVLDQFRRRGPDSPRLLLASLRCTNMGLNLQVACHVLMGPPSWNGAVEEQAKRRVLRIGQKQIVYFVYFVLLGTIEELVLARGGEKSDMITTVVGNDDGVVKTGSNFTRPDVNQAYLMTFEQGPHGPYTPTSRGDRTSPMWPETSVGDLEKLPLAAVGTNFARITTASLLSERGTIDRTKLARALYATAEGPL